MRKTLLGLLGLACSSIALLAQPAITQPPTNQVVAVGGTLTLSVTVSGTSPVYQWFKDSRFLVNATNSTLTVTNVSVADSGTYYVVATNSGGMIISLPVSVTVGNPTLFAWGNNSSGQLGNGTTSNTNRPITVTSNVVAGAVGIMHSLFVKTNGTLWAMGDNSSGQLGDGTYTWTKFPVSVSSNVAAVAAGYYHSLFVKTDKTLWAMGTNNFGQLGDGTYNRTNRPINVASNVVAVAAGYYHSLFVRTNGTLWAMGYNSSGQLGDGTTNNASLPICVASNVVAIAAGSSNSLFLKVDGTLWAMGKNRLGQLGDGTTNDANLPICVASNVAAVAAGYNHSLLVKTDGTLWAMGYNVNGQLGKGDFTSTNRPINVASNVVAVAAGYNHSLFLKTDGIICAMGANSFGQLGNGTTTITNRPINVSSISSVGNVLLGFGNSSLAIGAYLKSQVFISLSNLNQTYTGSACAVTVSTTPPGMPVDLTYNGFPFAPTNAGVYTVIGSVHDTTNYYSETAPVTLIILPVGLTDQALAVGEALNLSVAAGDVSQSYQWFKDSRLLWGGDEQRADGGDCGRD